MSGLQPASAAKISGESRHYPELDGVRGLAILGVLFAHGVLFLGVVPHSPGGKLLSLIFVPGWGGVDLFFTLSGFLITGILLRARNRPHYFRSFYMRRILRIFPIYYLFLIGTVLAVHFFPSISQQIPAGLKARISYFLYLQNWPVFWRDWGAMVTLWGAYWSLAVEEQFYMVWPAVIRFISVRTVLALCILGFLLGWPERICMMRHFGLTFGLMQWPLSRLDGLFAGAAIAIYTDLKGRAIPALYAAAAFIAGAATFVWLGISHRSELMSGNGAHVWGIGVTSYVLMSAGLIIATQHRIGWLHRVLTVRPLVEAGRLSYGMYIYHLVVYLSFVHAMRRLGIFSRGATAANAVAALFFIALAILIVTGVAELSFRFIEKPFLRLKRFFPSPAAPVLDPALPPEMKSAPV